MRNLSKSSGYPSNEPSVLKSFFASSTHISRALDQPQQTMTNCASALDAIDKAIIYCAIGEQDKVRQLSDQPYFLIDRVQPLDPAGGHDRVVLKRYPELLATPFRNRGIGKQFN